MSALSTHSFLNKTSSKSSSSSSFFFTTIKIFVAILFFLTINVAANGRMILPEIRNTRNANLPAKHYPCGTDDGPGKVLTTYTTNETIKVQWGIENPLDGSCFIDLSTNGKDSAFQNIHFMPNCADQVANFQVDVQLPEFATCEHCTLRFRWIPHLSKEIYLNCADIAILPPNKKSAPKMRKRKRCHQCK